jgi:hypothetical protein
LSNEEFDLTSGERIGRSQLNSSVGRTVGSARRWQLHHAIGVPVLIALGASIGATESVGNPPKGWALGGPGAHAYSARVDVEERRSGHGSGLLECSTRNLDTFGTLMQTIRAEDLRGRRIRLSGYLRTRDPEFWAALWMRIDGADTSPLAFDNMSDRVVRGDTEWSQYAIVLDVPVAAVQIAFGATLAGGGRIWVDDLVIEVVGKEVTTTDLKQPAQSIKIVVGPEVPSKPVNLGFDE